MWSLFTTLSSWFTELQCAYNHSQSFLSHLPLSGSQPPNLAYWWPQRITDVDFCCDFCFQAMASIWSCILPVTPVSHFLPSVSPPFTPLFSWMPLRVRGQRSELFKRSPDFCLFVFSKSVATLESIWGVGQGLTETRAHRNGPGSPPSIPSNTYLDSH